MNVKTVNSPLLGKSQRSEVPPIETQIRILYTMKLTRELEDRIERKLYRQGKVVGGVYVGRGQEAIAVGACIDLRPDDVVCPSHRDMGAYLLKGMDLRTILAQYMGRKTGPTKGKDANLHMGSLDHNLIAFISMLGDSVPVAAGIGLSFKMRGQDQIARIVIDLDDALNGATRSLSLEVPEVGEDGFLRPKLRTLNLKIPRGIRQGQTLRLQGQGGPGIGGGAQGDLFLEIEFKPHPLYRVDGADLSLDLPVAPWEAALGATVPVPTPGGTVDLKVPPGSAQGRKLRQMPDMEGVQQERAVALDPPAHSRLEVRVADERGEAREALLAQVNGGRGEEPRGGRAGEGRAGAEARADAERGEPALEVGRHFLVCDADGDLLGRQRAAPLLQHVARYARLIGRLVGDPPGACVRSDVPVDPERAHQAAELVEPFGQLLRREDERADSRAQALEG